jgi:hypothetical protein
MGAVLLAKPQKQAVVDTTMGTVLCAPASLRWEEGNAATAGVKRRRPTPERARLLPFSLLTTPTELHWGRLRSDRLGNRIECRRPLWREGR